VLRALLHAAQG